jgi:DNA-binding transcriptional LysR family regulator
VPAELDIARLRIFSKAADHGSFTAAAAALGLSQPAVSQQIAKLEKDLGVVLFERSPRAVRLTGPGKVLLGHTEAVLARLEDARRELAALSGPDAGELALAAFPSASATIVPPVIGAFRQSLPGVQIRLAEADPPLSLPQLLDGGHDVALAYDYPLLAQPRDRRLRWQILAQDSMAVALPEDHPLARRSAVPLNALRQQTWVAPYATVCRDALVQACRSTGFSPRVSAETNDYMAMLGLVRAGVGVAVVPRLVAAITVPPQLVLLPLAGTRLARTVAAVTRASGYQPASLRQLLQTMQLLVPRLGHPQLPFAAAA